MRCEALRIRYGQLGWLCDGAVYSAATPVMKPDHRSLLHMKYLLLF